MPQIVNHKGHEGPPGKKQQESFVILRGPGRCSGFAGWIAKLTHPTTPDFAKKRCGLYDGTHSNP
jgi:hypothetical protein